MRTLKKIKRNVAMKYICVPYMNVILDEDFLIEKQLQRQKYLYFSNFSSMSIGSRNLVKAGS